MASEYAQVQAGSPRAVNPSAFGTVEHAHETVRSVAMRLSMLVDRLCGTIPTDASVDKNPAPLDGLLGVATLQAADITRHCQAMNSALDRLEKQLP